MSQADAQAVSEVGLTQVEGWLPRLEVGRVLSSDTFVNDHDGVVWLRQTFEGSCADM